MANPLSEARHHVPGVGEDILPITPHDTNAIVDDVTGAELMPFGLYVETGGVLKVVTAKGRTRQFTVADNSYHPIAVQKVLATDTTATGIHGVIK